MQQQHEYQETTRADRIKINMLDLATILFSGAAAYFSGGKIEPEWVPLQLCVSAAAVAFYYRIRLGRGKTKNSPFWVLLTAVFWVFLVLILLPVFQSAYATNGMATCLATCKTYTWSLTVYADDFDKLPPSNQWNTLSAPYQRAEPKNCPLATTPYSFALCDQVHDFKEIDNYEATVLLFEAAAVDANAHGSLSLFDTRHGPRGSIGFCDGHVKMSTRENLQVGLEANPTRNN